MEPMKDTLFQFFRNTPEPQIYIDPEGEMFFNPAIMNMLGLKNDFTITFSIRDDDQIILGDPKDVMLFQKKKKRTVLDVQIKFNSKMDVSGTSTLVETEEGSIALIQCVKPDKPANRSNFTQDMMQFLATAPIAAIAVDQNGKFIQANQAYEKLWELNIDDIKEGFDFRSNERMKELGLMGHVMRALQGEVVDFPVVFYEPTEEQKQKGGRGRWVKAYAIPLKENTKVSAIVILAFDLSDQKYYEQSLLELISERDKDLRFQLEHFVNYAELSPDHIMRFDMDHRHVFVNQMVCDFLKLPRDKIIGKTHRQLGLPAEMCQLWEEEIDKVKQSRKPGRKQFDYEGFVFDWILVPETDGSGEVESVMTVSRDITPLAQAEKDLERSQIKLLDALKLANLATWEHDLTNDISILNERYCELVGIDYSSLPKPLSGQEFLKRFVHKKDQDVIREAFFKAARSRIPNYQDFIEFRVKSPILKQSILLYASVKITRDSQDSIIAYGTIQDITAFRKAEAELDAYRKNLEKMVAQRTRELKASESRLQDALNIAKLGTWEFNFEKKMFYVGAEVVEKMGTKYQLKKKTELSVHEFYELIHPEDRLKFQQANTKAIEAASEDFQDNFECRIVTDDGTIKYLFISIRVELDTSGNHLKHYGTIQDITEISAIETQKERLTSIVEATSDIVAIGRISGDLLYLNQAGQDLFGLDGQEFVSRERVNEMFTAESIQTIFEEGLPQAIDTGIWKGQTMLVDKNKNQLPFSQVILVHRDSSGNVDSYSTIMRDISELKQIEQDLIFKNNELDTFVYSASHDLKGPIASLIGLRRLIEYEIKEPLSLEYFDRYHQQVMRLDSIVQTLLQLARIKEIDLKTERVDFQAIIDSCISSFEHYENFSNITFEKQVNLEREVLSDSNLIRTILQNLIENGIKYSRQDSDPYLKINIFEKVKGGSIFISVEDNGLGIDEVHQHKIFNMFFRAHEGIEGSGLGLYILKNAVDKLSGKIMLDSKLNEGTIFTIELPFENN
jgi:PAS domain S-box-containing protein